MSLPAEPVQPGAPAAIRAVKGNAQQATAGTALPDSIVVEVTDSEGNPISGQRVIFVLADEAPGAIVTPDEAVTRSDGTAGARWVLGGSTGTQSVVVRLVSDQAPGGLEVRFTASATLPPANADRLELLDQPSSSATVDTPFERQPAVQITDADGNEVERGGVPVTAAVASGDGALGGTTTILTDSRGRAEFTDLRINGRTGEHVLIFAASGYTSVISESINVRAADNPPPPPPGPTDPVARDDAYAVNEGSQDVWDFDAPGVLVNDESGSGRSVELVGDASNGNLTLRSDGSFSYRPGPDYFGPDAFTYRIRQGSSTSNIATVSITVRPVNDSPRFSLRKDHNLKVSQGAGPQREENFVRDIILGPSNGNENNQQGTFIVTTDNDTLFSAGPSISYPDGTLTYTPSGVTGKAKVTVSLKDNGGTANGGADTSRSESFTITITSGD